MSLNEFKRATFIASIVMQLNVRIACCQSEGVAAQKLTGLPPASFSLMPQLV